MQRDLNGGSSSSSTCGSTASSSTKHGLLARAGAAIKNVFGGAAAGAKPVAQAAGSIKAAANKVETEANATVASNTKAVAAGEAKEQLEKWQTDWLDPEGAVQKGIGERSEKAASRELQHSVDEFQKEKRKQDDTNKKPATVMSDEVGTLVAKAALASFIKMALKEKDEPITFHESIVLLGTILYGRRK